MEGIYLEIPSLNWSIVILLSIDEERARELKRETMLWRVSLAGVGKMPCSKTSVRIMKPENMRG